jgi:hypothetical protein
MPDDHDEPKAKPRPFKLTPKEVEALRERAMQNARKHGWIVEDGLWRKPKPKEPTEKR